MENDFKPEDIIEYCNEQYEVIINYGNSGRVRENCKDGYIIDPFYWEIYGEKCKLISRKCNDSDYIGDRECPECEIDSLIESSLGKWKCLKCGKEFDENWLDDSEE